MTNGANQTKEHRHSLSIVKNDVGPVYVKIQSSIF